MYGFLNSSLTVLAHTTVRYAQGSIYISMVSEVKPVTKAKRRSALDLQVDRSHQLYLTGSHFR
jgi:hypothetical protein